MRLFVDNLTNIDFSFLHPHRGLVGETWLASIELLGELDEQGMVVDFGVVKRMIRDFLDDEIDHRLLVPTDSHCVKIHADEEQTKVRWKSGHEVLQTRAPHQAFALINAEVITAESLAKHCVQKLMPEFPSSVKQMLISFSPEHIDGPYYHYSHGLKKHAGNCQRIAHGHRSRIMIWRNGQLSQGDMKAWAQRWQDIYIASEEDLRVPGNAQEHSETEELHSFEYRAQQGEFFLTLPKKRCYFVDTDSTIEFIAQHIAKSLKKESPNDSFKVKAFEGIAKGAIAEA